MVHRTIELRESRCFSIFCLALWAEDRLVMEVGEVEGGESGVGLAVKELRDLGLELGHGSLASTVPRTSSRPPSSS